MKMFWRREPPVTDHTPRSIFAWDADVTTYIHDTFGVGLAREYLLTVPKPTGEQMEAWELDPAAFQRWAVDFMDTRLAFIQALADNGPVPFTHGEDRFSSRRSWGLEA